MSQANVPLPPGVARPKAPAEFPKYIWSPEGVMSIAKSAGDVPEGYTDYNPEDEAKVAAAKAAPATAKPAAAASTAAPVAGKIVPTMSKSATINALKSGGIAHSPNTSHNDLYTLLVNSIKSGLDEAKIVYDKAETDAEKLLSLFPSS